MRRSQSDDWRGRHARKRAVEGGSYLIREVNAGLTSFPDLSLSCVGYCTGYDDVTVHASRTIMFPSLD